MSHVPVAKKQVSDHPGSLGVTSPTDPKKKAADIDNKLKLYGVIQAFREGKYPSNRQIDETLDYVLNHSPIETNKLSREGKNLVEDFQNIIHTAKRMVAEKNDDELFQNFLYHTREIDYSKADLSKVNTSANKQDAQNDADQAVEHLRTLGKLIFTNSEMRKLLKDVGIIGRDIAADAAAKASEIARPDEHELNKVDETAPSKEWVGPNGERRGENDSAPDTGLAEKRDQLNEKKEQAKSQAAEARDQAQGHAENVARSADSAQQGQAQQGGSDEDRQRAAADAGKNQAQQEKEKVKSKVLGLKDRIPDEHKDRAKQELENAKDYARDKFPQERRDRFIYRLKKVVVENQSHRDYQEAIEFFLDRFENYQVVAKDAHSQAVGQGKDLTQHSAFADAQNELRTLLERFANGKSSQPIFDAVDQLYTDAKNDSELRNWFKRLDSYVREVLQEPGYVMKEECDREGRKLRDDSKHFFDPKNGKYSGHKDDLFNSLEEFFTAYADDELNVKFGHDIKKLTTDLLYDGEGNLKYKPHLWDDVRKVILPSLGSKLGYIPIPRIEYTDPQFDVVIENLTLESANLLPNIVEVDIRNYFKVSPYDAIKDQTKHEFTLSFSQIQADLKDVAFYIKKKTGFPKLQDSGVADVLLSGNGVSGKIHIASSGKKNHVFKVMNVDVNIDTLKFAVRESKHSMLISIFRPLAQGLIKKGVAKAIEGAIREGLVQLDAQLADISERMEDAKEEEGVSKFDAVKRSFNEKKSEAEHAKGKAEEKAPKGDFQITGKRDSKLVNWSSPNSMVEKEGDRLDAARASSNGTWKSPAFDIVSGTRSASSNSRSGNLSGTTGANDRKTGAATGAVAGAGAGVAAGSAAVAHHQQQTQTPIAAQHSAQPTSTYQTQNAQPQTGLVGSGATASGLAGGMGQTGSAYAGQQQGGVSSSLTGAPGAPAGAAGNVTDQSTHNGPPLHLGAQH